MSTLTAAVQNEWLKLKAKRRSKVFLIIVITLTILLVVLHYATRSSFGFFIVQPNQLAKTVLNLMLQLVIPLLAFITSVDSLASEKNQGTLKVLFTQPASRLKLYFSKLISLSIANAIMVLAVFLIATIGGLFSASNGFLLETFQALIICLLVLVPLGLISAWGLLMGQLFTNGTMAIGLGLLGLFLIGIGQLFIDRLYFISPLTYLDFYNPLIRGNLTTNFFITLLLMISYCIMLVSAGLLKITSTEN